MKSLQSHTVSARSRRRSAAFSLIELLTVIAVMGISLGMVTFSTGTFTAASLSASSREFADFVNLCRSEAIAGHTVVRLGVAVTPFEDNPDSSHRRYASWRWNKRDRQFEQLTSWKSLPGDVVFEPQTPTYIRDSQYADDDASSVRGEFVLSEGSNTFTATGPSQEAVEIRFVEFLPSGRARIPGGEQRQLIFVLRPGMLWQSEGGGASEEAGESGSTGEKGKGREPSERQTFNWSQININSLTGRFQMYRP